MGAKRLDRVPSPILVLAAIIKLHDLRKGYSQRGLYATRGNIQQLLKKTYNRDLSRNQIDHILKELQKQKFILKRRGDLRKKHMIVFSINPHRLFQDVFTVIKLDLNSAYVVNRYEGIVYDLESLETLFAES